MNMDPLMRSMLLREIGARQRAVARAEQLLRGRQRQLDHALGQYQQAQHDAAEDRLIDAHERAEASWGRIVGKRAA